MSVAIIDAEGDYGAVIVSGANLRLAEEDIRDALDVIQRASVLVLQNEIPDAANVFAAEAAKRQGARVVFNAAPTRPLDPLLAQNVDILVVNAVEAEMMCGVAVASLAAAAEAAAQLSSQVSNVIVTAGGMGLALVGVRATASGPRSSCRQFGRHPWRRRYVHRRARCPIGRRVIAFGSHSLRQCRGIAFCQHTG